jgi:hypothetical protein
MLPSVAMNDKGEAVVLWLAQDQENQALQAATRDSEKKWSSSTRISTVEKQFHHFNAVVDREGNIYAGWQMKNSSSKSFSQFTKKQSKGSWGAPVNVVEPGDGFYSAFVFDPQGNMINIGCRDPDHTFLFSKDPPWTIQYHHQANEKISIPLTKEPDHPILKTVTMNKEGKGFAAWSSLFGIYLQGTWFEGHRAISDSFLIGGLEVRYNYENFEAAMNTKGDLVLIWKKSGVIETVDYIDGQWSKGIKLMYSITPFSLTSPKVAIDEEGNILAIWSCAFSEVTSIFAAYKPAKNPWNFPVVLSTLEKTNVLDVKAINRGQFVVIWDEQKEDLFSVSGATFTPATLEWSPVALLSPPSQKCLCPSFAFNEKGEGVIAWTWILENDSHIQVADLNLD